MDLYAGYGVTRGFPLFYRFTIPHRLAKLLPWAEEAGRQARIHTDRRADMIAAGAGAEAVMAGRNIFFRSGRFAPETPRGTALVLHELHHLHQQGRLRQASDWMATERAERESVAVERLAYRILSAKEPRRLQGHAPSHVAATLSLDLARPDRRRQGAGQAPAARSATAGGAAPAPPPMRAADSREVDLPGEHRSPDASEVAAQVFRMLERKLRVDRERLGLGRI